MITKENEKWDKYHDLVKELKMLWNTKMTVIPVVTGVIQKGLAVELEELETEEERRLSKL